MARTRFVLVFPWLAVLSLAACATPLSVEGEQLADEIVDAPGATGEGFGDPERAIDGVRGGGFLAGSTDVYSLDYAERPYLVLGWSGRRVTNGPGVDIVVFENAFRTMWDEHAYFMDPIVVAVSLDGQHWVDLPHAYVGADPRAYENDRESWEGFAGVTPVEVNDDTQPMSWLDPLAGGDGFDLDVLGTEGLEGEIRAQGFRYVRLTSAAIVTNPETGVPFPRDPISNGADIDGVAARSLVSGP